MSHVTLVYVTRSALLNPPLRTVFHARGRSQWPSYPENPEKPGTAMREGEERHWTRCGLLAYDSAKANPSRMEALRSDNALLIGRSCRKCWR